MVCMKKAWVLSYPFERTAKTESSLGTQSLCWFCHVSAHLLHLAFICCLISDLTEEDDDDVQVASHISKHK